MTSREVTRTYLQMLSQGDLKPSLQEDPTLRLERAAPCPPELYRFLYGTVGEAYHWVDRRGWTDDEIMQHVGQAGVSLWVLRRGDELAGYFELVSHEDGSIEIAYFGLLPGFLGHGLGKHLLSVAVRQAWEMDANRVWLHTCTLDHPAALPNYVARGFREFKRETYQVSREPKLT